MNEVKALCFDVFGTVVDWRGGIDRDWYAFADRLAGALSAGDGSGAQRQTPVRAPR